MEEKKNSPWKLKKVMKIIVGVHGKKCSTRISQLSGKGHGLKPINIFSFPQHNETSYSDISFMAVRKTQRRHFLSHQHSYLRACFLFYGFSYDFPCHNFYTRFSFYSPERTIWKGVDVHFKWQKHVLWIILLQRKVLNV